MNKKLLKQISCAMLLGPPISALASNIDATNKYAWSENGGWSNFNDTNGGVTVYNDHLEGYAWAENIGWIRLGTHTSGGTHTYAKDSQTNYGVNNSAGTLSGYAWSENAGWIKFDPAHGGGVSINATTGDFDGYAWGENVGWIHFQSASPAYKVNQVLPSVELSVDSSTGTEAAATQITVTATASSAVSGNQTVNLAVTGVNTSDYTLIGTTITILDGQTIGTATFTIADDSEFEGTENATLTVSSPSAGITLGSTTTQNVSITDNDSAPPTSSPPRPKPTTRPLRVEMKGTGTGSVTSEPEGIDCSDEDDAVCKYTFDMNTEITLTPKAGPDSEFDHWSGDRDCSGGQFVLEQSWVGMLCYAYFKRTDTSIPPVTPVTPTPPVTPSTSTLGAYYIPGAENDGKSFVRITNTNDTPVEVKGTLYHQEGHILGTAETVLFPELAANATGVFNRASLAEQMETTSWGQDIAWLDLTSPEDGLRVMNMYRNETRTLANMSLVAENALYNLPGSGETDEGFALIINTSDEPVSVTGTLYNAENGEVLGTPDAVLFDNLNAKAIGLLSAPLLEQKVGTTPWQRAWLQITAPTDNLKLMNLNLNNGTILNMSHVVENALFNLPGTLVTKDSVKVRFTNTTDEAMQVKGILYHREGQILGNADAVIIEELAPHATSELSMFDFEERFGSDPWTSRARLVITQPTNGLKLMGLIRSSETGTVANASAVGKNRIFNVPPPGNFDKGWIRLINTTAFEAKVFSLKKL